MPVKREKNMVIDEFTVKNTSTAPIARLTIEAIFYDKGGAVIAGGKNFVNGLLGPGEVQTVAPLRRREWTRSWIRRLRRRPPRRRRLPRKPPPTRRPRHKNRRYFTTF